MPFIDKYITYIVKLLLHFARIINHIQYLLGETVLYYSTALGTSKCISTLHLEMLKHVNMIHCNVPHLWDIYRIESLHEEFNLTHLNTLGTLGQC